MTQPIVNNMGGGLGNMDFLKSQVLTMFALKSNNTEDGIFMAIWAIVLISIIDVCFRYLPVVINKIHGLVQGYISNKVSKHTNISNLISIGEKHEEETSIILVRNYAEKDSNMLDYELVDAVLDYVCSLDNAKHIKYIKRFYLDTKIAFEINKDISVQLENITFDNQTGNISSITIKLISYKLKISEIKEFINKLHAEYRIEKNNKLGTQKYFFNEIHVAPMREMNGRYRFETAPKRITFNMTPFNTFKSMNNIFGSHINDIRERVNLFVNCPEWYSQRGIPHTLGILLHGPPGCGKTSLIKAIAKDTNRHVFNITLRKTTTQRQLLNLFFDENVTVFNLSNENITFAIPLDKRIYVIEDIDCMTDIVLDRKYLELLKRMNNKKHVAVKDLHEFVNSSDTDYDEITVNTTKISSEYNVLKDTINKQDVILSTPLSNIEQNNSNQSNYPVISMNSQMSTFHKFDSSLDNAFNAFPIPNNSVFNNVFREPVNDKKLEYNKYLINNKSSSDEENENENENENVNVNVRNGSKDKKSKKKKDKDDNKEESKDELTLSFILNLLDGVLETPGRIIIMTSNYPKRLDKALIRPGRIDINVQFDKANLEMINQMICHFYNKSIDEIDNLNLKINEKIDKKYTPAEVISILCNNYNNYEKAIQQLNNGN
jgi:DNA polymerase III delta prime subunit